VQGLFPAANPAAPDFPALYVGMSILRDRLFEEIRTKRNLSYAPGAWIFQRGVNVGSIYVTTPRPNEALPLMAEEIRKMQNAPASETEVRNATNAVRTRLLQNLEASDDIASWLGRYELRGGGWQKVDAFISRLNSITPEDVRLAMSRYAHKLDFAVLGKIEGVDEKILTTF
jgi:predicted Zn-dependent peptidase